MKQDIQAKPDSGDRRVMMEWMVGRYSSLSQEEIAEVLRYLTRDASATDVGILASNDRIYPQYRKLCADHRLDRPGAAGWIATAFLCAIVLAAFIRAVASA